MKTKRIIAVFLMISLMIYPQLHYKTSAAVNNIGSKVLNVLVLNFEPVIEERGGKKLHEIGGWNDPKILANECISDFDEISGGYIKYKIADWVEIDDFPMMKDGTKYDDMSFVNTLEEARAKMWNWWDYDKWNYKDFTFDYEYYLDKYKIPEKVEKGVYDEVWIFAGPFSGGYESQLVGRGAYWCNSPGINRTDSPLFPVMMFNYERGVGEMLEDFGHRMEFVMSRTFGSCDYTKPIKDMNKWELFTLYDQKSPGNAGCGNVHFAPNSTSDYDWGNTNKVWTNFNDWMNYPDFKGNKVYTDCSSWGSGDTRLHHKWWFSCMPKATGIDEKGYSNNWWEYFTTSNKVEKLTISLENTAESGSGCFLTKGESSKFVVTAVYTDGTAKDVTQIAKVKSSNGKIVNVISATNSVNGVSDGKTVLSTILDGIPTSASISVSVVNKLVASVSQVSIKQNESKSISLYAQLADGTKILVTKDAKWAASNNKIVEVGSGIVKGISKGSAAITISYRGKSLSIPVKVSGI